MEHYLGEKLKKLRESRGWTQADLAKRLNKAEIGRASCRERV